MFNNSSPHNRNEVFKDLPWKELSIGLSFKLGQLWYPVYLSTHVYGTFLFRIRIAFSWGSHLWKYVNDQLLAFARFAIPWIYISYQVSPEVWLSTLDWIFGCAATWIWTHRGGSINHYYSYNKDAQAISLDAQAISLDAQAISFCPTLATHWLGSALLSMFIIFLISYAISSMLCRARQRDFY